MGKNKHKHTNNEKSNNNGQKFRIQEGAKDFAKLDLKKFKKKEGDYYESKKELKRAYYSRLVDDLPEAIEFVVFDGYKDNPEVQETKNAIFAKIASDSKFVEYLVKCIKDDEEIDNIKMLPVLIAEILEKMEAENVKLRANDPNAQVYDGTDLIELSTLILKKRRKKLLEKGVDEKLAFDLLSVIPTDKIMKKSAQYRIRTMLNIMYNYANKVTIPVDVILKFFIPEDYENLFICFSLLERRRKYSELKSDAQRALYNSITDWCFKHLEDMEKGQIYEVLMRYIKTRKADQKDAERRYDFTLISESEYPKIAKIVSKLIETDKDAAQYLK